MYRYVKNLAAVVLLVMTMTLLGACGSETESSLSAGIVVGPHSNARVIPVNSAEIVETLYDVAASYGSITLVRCDGAPEVVFRATVPQEEVSGLSRNKLKSIAESYTAEMQAYLSDVCAVNPEVDTLEAIRLAAQNMADGDRKVMMILDNGLSTTGYLDFTAGLLEASPEDIVAALERAQALPDLSGITVQWCFLGQTAAPQEPLSQRQLAQLRDIWYAVLISSGAADVRFVEGSAGSDGYTGLPAVSLVNAEESSLHVEIPTTVLDSASVQFVGDSDVFIDRNKAMAEVAPIADQLLAHPDSCIYIVGTTAGGKAEDFCQELSERRAMAVKRLLTECGVPSEQMVCLGLGFHDPWHIDDLDASGKQIESLAAQNRKVVIMDVNSPDAAAF